MNPATSRRCLALVLHLLALTCNAATGAKAGEMAPEHVGDTLDNTPVSVADFKGKVVVVSFWASWCPPCLKEMPILEGIQKTAGKGRLQVIAVNTDSIELYRKLARRLTEFELLITHDNGKDSSQAYGVNGIPHMVIIDRSGRIVRVNRGYDEDRLDQIVADINRALTTPN